MNKEIRQAVVKRACGGCENCHTYVGESGELHHAIGGNGKRTQHEKVETCFYLCSECHDAHDNNKYILEKFKLMAQINLMNNYLENTEIEEVRRDLGGRLYG